MTKLKIGYITMTHGIKGELKLYSDFSKKEKILIPNFPVIIKNQQHTITSVRPHKNHFLVTFDSLKDINLVEEFRNQTVFVDLEDIPLESGEVILETLIGYSIECEQEVLGKVKDILYNKGGILLEIDYLKKYYIPYNNYYIEKILENEQKIKVFHAKDLIL